MVTINGGDSLLTDAEVASRLGLKNPKTLAIWRTRGKFSDLLKPTYVGKCVRYQPAVVEQFIKARTIDGCHKSLKVRNK